MLRKVSRELDKGKEEDEASDQKSEERNEDLLFLMGSFSNRIGEHALKLARSLKKEKEK